MSTLGVVIRWMLCRDMPEVLGIEAAQFEFPWKEEEFVRVLRDRNIVGRVAENSNGRVLGYLIYELHADRVHILSMAVHAAMLRRGIGSELVRDTFKRLNSDQRTRVLLEVREANLNAQLFFQALGFRAVAVLRDFYDDTTEDAYVMQYRSRQPELSELTKAQGK